MYFKLKTTADTMKAAFCYISEININPHEFYKKQKFQRPHLRVSWPKTNVFTMSTRMQENNIWPEQLV